MDRIAFVAACTGLGISLTEDQLASFDEFEDDLYVVNEVMNLTRIPREECYIRHFLDSLLLGVILRDLSPSKTVLDIGTGPGVPSWILACAFPEMEVVGMDSNGKMLGFLQAHLRPNLTDRLERAEESGIREEFDIVTGRAVAPLNIQLEISAAPVKIGGYFVPMRTPQDDLTRDYWTKLGLELLEVKQLPLPGTDIIRAFPIFQKVKSTYASFPRRWGDIKRKPL